MVLFWRRVLEDVSTTLREGKLICDFGHRVIKVSYCMASSCKEIREAKKGLKDRENVKC